MNRTLLPPGHFVRRELTAEALSAADRGACTPWLSTVAGSAAPRRERRLSSQGRRETAAQAAAAARQRVAPTHKGGGGPQQPKQKPNGAKNKQPARVCQQQRSTGVFVGNAIAVQSLKR